jgi:hypothetical protein
MRQHLPSKQEILELSALLLMIVGVQWSLGSWGWTALFSLGFIWNLSVLNGWVLQQSGQKNYRFSMLRMITVIHHTLLLPAKRFPRLQVCLSALPAGLFFGFLAYMFSAPIPWWAVILGSTAFLLIRRQLKTFTT